LYELVGSKVAVEEQVKKGKEVGKRHRGYGVKVSSNEEECLTMWRARKEVSSSGGGGGAFLPCFVINTTHIHCLPVIPPPVLLLLLLLLLPLIYYFPPCSSRLCGRLLPSTLRPKP